MDGRRAKRGALDSSVELPETKEARWRKASSTEAFRFGR